MHSYTENYGSDRDGNRGRYIKMYELDKDDEPEIQSQIIEYIQSTEDLPSNPFTVHLITPDTNDDIEFEIDPSEYLSKDECETYLTEEE